MLVSVNRIILYCRSEFQIHYQKHFFKNKHKTRRINEYLHAVQKLSKTILLEAWTGSNGSRQLADEGGTIVSPTH
jgi:hypothetical protein